jgi:ribonuclease III
LNEYNCEELLQERIGYRFSDTSLLQQALTHKSYSNEKAGCLAYNERLEFLGDAVLDLVVSDRLFHFYPSESEGELTRIRAEVVNEKGLACIARRIGLGECLSLGRGEERSGGRDKDSLNADALEALLGAVFRDGGLGPATAVIEKLFDEAIRHSAGRKAGIDHKTRLQEFLQGRKCHPPQYVLLGAEGPDHDRTYMVEVRDDIQALGQGQGKSKKAAEQEAARQALERLGA